MFFIPTNTRKSFLGKFFKAPKTKSTATNSPNNADNVANNLNKTAHANKTQASKQNKTQASKQEYDSSRVASAGPLKKPKFKFISGKTSVFLASLGSLFAARLPKKPLSLFLGILLSLSILTLSLYWMQGNIQKTAEKLQLFALEEIVIEGLQLTNPYQIAKLGNLKLGDSLLFLNTRALEKKLSALPSIEKVQVRRRYPNILDIKITEKKIFFLLQNKALGTTKKPNIQFTLLNKEGLPIVTKPASSQEYRNNGLQNMKLGDYFIIEVALPRQNLAWNKLNQEVTENTNTNTSSSQPPRKTMSLARQQARLQQFFALIDHLPSEEQDFFSLFSGINLRNEYAGMRLYSKDGQRTFYLGNELDLEKLRKARYAYLYMLQAGLHFRKIDVSSRYVHFLAS